MECKYKLFKVLSRNDTGETNSHQSGITLPKKLYDSPIFPNLGTDTLNPRTAIEFVDEFGESWIFQLIYYNDIHFGKPREKAHNEYRLTCVKEYLRHCNAKAGDQIWFGITEKNVRMIGHVKKDSAESKKVFERSDGVVVIKLSSNWTSVTI